MVARPRAEESELAAFVDSCVNFKSNIEFTSLSAYKANNPNGLSGPFAILIGTKSELQSGAVEQTPLHCPILSAALPTVEENRTFGVLANEIPNAAASAFVRLVLAAVPAKASRTNCPARPDAMATLLAAALEEAPKKTEIIDIFAMSPAFVPVAVAVARGAQHNFTAKDGRAASAYLAAAPKIRVVLCAESQNAAPPPPRLAVIASAIQLCQRLVDAPTSLLNTTTYTLIAKGIAATIGVEIDVIGGAALREKGYGGMYAVGKCAEEPPQLVTLTYKPKSPAAAKQNVSLVGKGIVYDCGGLALKQPTFMSGMKHDMGGSAAVLCGFIAAVQLNAPQQLSCTLCLAENAIGPAAYRNDDIIVMKSGKTVEVMNTDAEGRIVLGDGVFHATNELAFTPDILIDMATLTGAQGIATGHRHAAIYANDADAEADILKAGIASGDTCFPVVYCPEYHEAEFKSPIADMRNLMKQTNNAGVSCGGQFVESHISPKFTGKYIHVDLAFPAFNDKGATGYGVALLAEYLEKL